MKNCKKCKKPRNHSNWLISLCMECYYEKQNKNSLWKRKTINKVSSKRIQIAKFSKETKRQILERDISCIICWNPWTDCHHIFYSQEANYWEDRNNVDQWVLLCRLCHGKAHACKKWEWVRQECINYLN